MKHGSPSFTVLLVDGINLLAAKVKGVTYKVESITEKSDGLGDTSEAHSPVGMSKASLTQDGAFFDDGVNSMHEALKAPSTAPRVICFSDGGTGFTGCLGAVVTTYEVIIANGALTKANAGYEVSGEVEAGVILEHAAHTGDWVSPQIDHGASSPDGGVGYLQVSALAGLTGFVGKIRHSPDNLAWADLVTFVNVTAAPGAQRIAVAGVVDRYLRFEGDVSGVGSISVFSGFSRT